MKTGVPGGPVVKVPSSQAPNAGPGFHPWSETRSHISHAATKKKNEDLDTRSWQLYS